MRGDQQHSNVSPVGNFGAFFQHGNSFPFESTHGYCSHWADAFLSNGIHFGHMCMHSKYECHFLGGKKSIAKKKISTHNKNLLRHSQNWLSHSENGTQVSRKIASESREKWEILFNSFHVLTLLFICMLMHRYIYYPCHLKYVPMTIAMSFSVTKETKNPHSRDTNAEIKWKLICQKFQIHFACSCSVEFLKAFSWKNWLLCLQMHIFCFMSIFIN